MRLIKILGIVAIAVAAFTSIFGVGSAIAETTLEKVVLCKMHIHECPADEHFPANTVIHATSTNTLFLSSLGNISCGSSAMLLKTTSLLVHGEVTDLTFANCVIGKQACTVTALHLPWLFKGELQADDQSYEVLMTEKNPNGEPQLKVVCGSLISCTFGAATVLFAALLSVPEKLNVLQELASVAGLLCPKMFIWHSEYEAECLENNELKECWIKMES